jgi:hypothetical protein
MLSSVSRRRLETEYISTRSWYRNVSFLRDRIRRIFFSPGPVANADFIIIAPQVTCTHHDIAEMVMFGSVVLIFDFQYIHFLIRHVTNMLMRQMY